VTRLLNDLEADGIIVSRGERVRPVSRNPRFVAARELAALLERLVDNDLEFVDRLSERRRRPRRPGKPLVSPQSTASAVQLERIKDWSAAEDGDDSALQTIEKLARFEQRLRD